MTRVGVLGAAGKMGETVCRAVFGDPELELVAAVDLAAPAGFAARGGVEYANTPEALVSAGCDVAVDFTVAPAALSNLLYCAEHHIHAVCGTTGLSSGDLTTLEAAFSGPAAPNAVVAPNFAISAVLMLRMCELAAPYMDGVEIIELHHGQKRDAPSGTAIETAHRIAAARAAAGSPPYAPDPTEKLELKGARGASGPGGIALHSVRLPGLVAHEEVHFGALGQGLTIRQDSFDRTSFMPGVILAVKRVGELSGLTLGLEGLLGI